MAAEYPNELGVRTTCTRGDLRDAGAAGTVGIEAGTPRSAFGWSVTGSGGSPGGGGYGHG